MSQTKQVEVIQSDTLRTIALRELGDATRWPELATLNDLRMPFIVASFREADRLEHTLIWGDSLLVPWESNSAQIPSPTSNFGIDVALPKGRLSENDGGDLHVISGSANLIQALSNRVKTQRSEMVYHPKYGCNVSVALGMRAIPMVNLMAAAWTYEALLEEPRVSVVQSVEATAQGDSLLVNARVLGTNDNTPVDLNLVLNP